MLWTQNFGFNIETRDHWITVNITVHDVLSIADQDKTEYAISKLYLESTSGWHLPYVTSWCFDHTIFWYFKCKKSYFCQNISNSTSMLGKPMMEAKKSNNYILLEHNTSYECEITWPQITWPKMTRPKVARPKVACPKKSNNVIYYASTEEIWHKTCYLLQKILTAK